MYESSEATLRIERAVMDLPEAIALMHALDVESQSRYEIDLTRHFKIDLDEVAPGHGAFYLAYLGDEAVGCGAIRMHGGDAELKRMYVAPAARGRGIARAILRALEAEACRLGASRIILETGNKQVEALALYQREGYEEISRYEPYVYAQHSICMAKPLLSQPPFEPRIEGL